ncbi:MAG: hypothetical protein Q9170_004457 [Blastenia crenularia]
MSEATNFSQWSPDKLVERVTLLETQLREQTERYDQLLQSSKPSSPALKHQRTKIARPFDPSKYSTRFIALKFAYLGQKYNGLEYHANNATPLSTIEEELWKALHKAKLIFPTPNASLKEEEPNWEGCEYSKCGRTDKSVSAFGQVISLRVRSNRPLDWLRLGAGYEEADVETREEDKGPDGEQSSIEKAMFDPIKDEIPYPQVLNRLLPPEIRVLAWCPFPPPDFSARFSCTERCYKYFFTQPAFAPTTNMMGALLHENYLHGQRKEGWLDIEAMRETARKFEGSHDFRNFCKVDPSKQIDIFVRAIHNSDIVEMNLEKTEPGQYPNLSGFPRYQTSGIPQEQRITPQASVEIDPPRVPQAPKVYAFQVRGSGFLWHQVRHMVAVLFLVGQGLEKPSVIDNMLDMNKTPQKPVYDMADAEPLVLEDCKFDSELQWVHLGENLGSQAGTTKSGSKGDGKYGIGGVVDGLWKVWHRHKIDETIAGSLLDLVVQGHKSNDHGTPHEKSDEQMQERPRKNHSQMVFLGGDSPRSVGQYTPILERQRMERVDVVNARYIKRKGLHPPERNSAKVMSHGV